MRICRSTFPKPSLIAQRICHICVVPKYQTFTSSDLACTMPTECVRSHFFIPREKGIDECTLFFLRALEQSTRHLKTKRIAGDAPHYILNSQSCIFRPVDKHKVKEAITYKENCLYLFNINSFLFTQL